MATSSNNVNVTSPHIPIFKGDSYEYWSIKMKMFESQDPWELVENGCATSGDDEAKQKENIKKGCQALFFIQLVVDETIFSSIAPSTPSKQPW